MLLGAAALVGAKPAAPSSTCQYCHPTNTVAAATEAATMVFAMPLHHGCCFSCGACPIAACICAAKSSGASAAGLPFRASCASCQRDMVCRSEERRVEGGW